MTREQFIKDLTGVANLYADEAENQEGKEYWDSFETTEAVFMDFILFVQNL